MVIDEAIGARVCRLAGMQVEHATRCLGWGGSRVHDGVHEARKALRRARALLKLVAPRVGSATNAVDRELAAVGRELSSLRDAMARVETLDRLLTHAGDDAPLLRRCRRAAAGARAQAARAALTADPGFASLRTRLCDAGTALRALPWSRLHSDDLHLALDHAGARARRARDRACKHDRDAQWHRWRRRMRLLVHARETLRNGGLALRSSAADELQLATALGRAQDLVVLKRDCANDVPFARADRKPLRRVVAQKLRQARRRIARSTGALAAEPDDESPDTETPDIHLPMHVAAHASDAHGANTGDGNDRVSGSVRPASPQ